MKHSIWGYVGCVALLCLLSVGISPVSSGHAQNTTETPALVSAEDGAKPVDNSPVTFDRSREAEFIDAVGSLLETVTNNEAKLVKLGRALSRAKTEDERNSIKTDIQNTEAVLNKQRRSLREIASGLSSLEFKPGTVEDVDWKSELQALLGPLFRELRQFTQRPRKIEAYRTEIASKKALLSKIDQALKRINDLADATEVRVIDTYLDTEKKRLLEQQAQVENDIAVATLQLQQILDDRGSLTETISGLFAMFFKTRGKNLLIAIGIFFGVLVVLRAFHALFRQRILSGRFRSDGFAFRLLDISISAFVVLMSVSSGLAVLYVSGDWVLLGLSIVLVVSIAWSAKQGIGAFFEQTKLLLNLGAVREGERIVYNGLPFRVERLHYYTTLINPALSGARLRVRLDDLINRSSRPYSEDERWFPTDPGDWVCLNDDTFGQIASQTSEYVVLTLFGNTPKTYITTDFLAKEPANLSGGFNVRSTFGVDYRHQSEATTAIPERLEASVRAAFTKEGYDHNLVSLTVDFKEAGASSLDIAIYAAFTGDVASACFQLERLIQKTAVNTATTCNWVIPFPQLTVEQRIVTSDTQEKKEDEEASPS
ncbi:hypothetical protein [Desulfovibrio inopinatus]|uniref:hypothetical protein n=1 Tax=Desulfovibrio inopinatus TaxID=102109 RepID=UPI000429E0FF|nr:hypothetical protein [Desulfovibrio inopinatus]